MGMSFEEEMKLKAQARRRRREKEKADGEMRLEKRPPPKTWGEVPGMAMENVGASGSQYFKDLYHAVTNPVETGKGLMDVASGALQANLPFGEFDLERGGRQPYRESWESAKQYARDRGWTGNEQAIMNTLAYDPVGALGDISIPIGLGGGAIAKIPQLAKAGQTISKYGNLLDPATALGTTAVGTARKGRNLTQELMGGVTGKGKEAFSESYKAGREGGQPSRDVTAGRRGLTDQMTILEDARRGMQNMRHSRQAAYKADKEIWAAMRTELDFQPIKERLYKLSDSFMESTGQEFRFGPDTEAKLMQIVKLIESWEYRPSLHTVEGLDTLKMKIDDLMPAVTEQSQSAAIVGTMRDEVKNIILESPVGDVYKKAMGEYELALQLENEIKKALSLGKKASADTAMRKLLSVTRSNVQTNFGTRANMVRALEEAGETSLMPKIAGEVTKDWTPSGMAGTVFYGSGIGNLMMGGNPLGFLTMPLQSPRLMGAASQAAGKASRIADFIKAKMKNVGITPDRARKTIQAAVQAGRIDRETAQMALDEIDLINKG
jgi:hypothetical protein